MTTATFTTMITPKDAYKENPPCSRPFFPNSLPLVMDSLSMEVTRSAPTKAADPNSVKVVDIAKEALVLTRSDSLTEATAVSFDSSSLFPGRLNKFVRRLHDMLLAEQDNGIVEWRRGLLVLHSTDAFSKQLLPRWFKTKNFKTFRRQLNYYGFVHVRSFSTTGSTTTALWVNRELAQSVGSDDVNTVLLLKRVEPTDAAKTAQGRRERKTAALHTCEADVGVSTKTLQMDHIRWMANDTNAADENASAAKLLLLLSKSC